MAEVRNFETLVQNEGLDLIGEIQTGICRIECQKEDLPDKRPEDSHTECQKILQIEYKIMSNRILVDHSKERHLCFFAGFWVKKSLLITKID